MLKGIFRMKKWRKIFLLLLEANVVIKGKTKTEVSRILQMITANHTNCKRQTFFVDEVVRVACCSFVCIFTIFKCILKYDEWQYLYIIRWQNSSNNKAKEEDDIKNDYNMRFGILELRNRVMKTSYTKWRHTLS